MSTHLLLLLHRTLGVAADIRTTPIPKWQTRRGKVSYFVVLHQVFPLTFFFFSLPSPGLQTTVFFLFLFLSLYVYKCNREERIVCLCACMAKGFFSAGEATCWGQTFRTAKCKNSNDHPRRHGGAGVGAREEVDKGLNRGLQFASLQLAAANDSWLFWCVYATGSKWWS